jgi:hypothetical protein
MERWRIIWVFVIIGLRLSCRLCQDASGDNANNFIIKENEREVRKEEAVFDKVVIPYSRLGRFWQIEEL